MAKQTPASIIKAQAATILELTAERDALAKQVADLTPKPRRDLTTKYWDDFATRGLAMQWSKETGGRVVGRPAQRAEH
jgi:hypothetical protein